jgi:hypothetical protein
MTTRWCDPQPVYLTHEQTLHVLELSKLAAMLEAHPEIRLPAGVKPAAAAVFVRQCLDAALGVTP